MKRLLKFFLTVTLSIFFMIFLVGCYGTTLTAGGGRIKSPAGVLVIKDETFGYATNPGGSKSKNMEMTLTIFKKDTTAFTEDEYDKIMSQKFTLEDSKGNQYDLAYGGLEDDNFLIMIGFIVPESASGFKLRYPNSNPIILRH